MATVLIAGGTGMIGTRLSKLLRDRGYQVTHLSRNRDLQAEFPAYAWDLKRGTVDEEAIRTADYVINLAGAGIADKRWTEARKQVIIRSRVEGNGLLLRKFLEFDHRPKAYLSSAGIGYYGDRGAEWLDEEAGPGDDFVAKSCIAWENAVEEVAASGIRTIIFRMGVVLSTQGGAMEKMMLPLKFLVGTYFGDGKQYYSWIHIDDVCRAFIWAIEHEEMRGVYNAVAPQPVPHETLTRTLADAMDQPAIVLPAPAFTLHLALGEMANVILTSTRVSSEKLSGTGFAFRFPDLEEAIRDLLHRKV